MGEIVINEALVVSSAEPAGKVKHFATRVNAFVQGVHVRTCSLLFFRNSHVVPKIYYVF